MKVTNYLQWIIETLMKIIEKTTIYFSIKVLGKSDITFMNREVTFLN